MAADPTVSIFGVRGLSGNGDVATADIADDAVTAAKVADGAIDDSAKIGSQVIASSNMGLGSVGNALTIAAAVVNEYHRTNTTNSVAASRDIAYTDVGDVVACTGPVTLTVPLDMTSTGSTGWRLGQFCFIECANASTVTLAAAGGVTLTAPSGLTLDGSGSCGILLRVGTNSWRFHMIAGNNRVPNAALADVATSTIKGRTSSGTGDVEDLTAAQARTVLGLGGAALLNVGTTAGTVATGDHTMASHPDVSIGATGPGFLVVDPSTSAISNTAAYMRGGPFTVPFPMTVSEVAIRIGTQAGDISIAILSASTGDRLATTGTVACPAASSTVSWLALISSVALDPGLYIIAISCSDAGCVYYANSSMSGRAFHIATSHPVPASNTLNYTSGGAIPAVMLR